MKTKILLSVIGVLFIINQAFSQVSYFTAANTTCSSVDLYWMGDGISFFSIYKDGTLYTTTSTQTHNITITGLTPNTKYTFGISTYNSNGAVTETKYCYPVTNPIPASPTNLTSHEWGAALVLTWTASTSSVKGYTVNQISPVSRSLGTTTANSFAVQSYLQSGVNIFTVSAYDDCSTSSTQTIGYYYTSPSAPTNVAMHEFGTAYVITWTAPSTTVSGYRISQNYPTSRIIGNTTSTSFCVNSYLSSGMNVFSVYSYDKFGLLSGSVNVGCNYNSTLKSALSDVDVEKLKEQYGLDKIINLNASISSAEITISPNPATDLIFVNGVTDFKAIITDVNGKNVIQIDNAYEGINVSNLSKGLYIIRIESQGKTTIKKFSKQ